MGERYCSKWALQCTVCVNIKLTPRSALSTHYSTCVENYLALRGNFLPNKDTTLMYRNLNIMFLYVNMCFDACRYFHIISRYVLPHIQISAMKIVTGFYEGKERYLFLKIKFSIVLGL